MIDVCSNCGQTKLNTVESIPAIEKIDSCVDEVEETIFSVPYTQIAQIEYLATVKAKTIDEAVKKVRDGDCEEIDEQDSTVLATDIDPANVEIDSDEVILE